MLRTTLGPEIFVKGVGVYLKRYAHGNSEASGLWEALSEASGRDVGAFMRSWITRTGFPVVTVEETADGLKLRQNRFLSACANRVIELTAQARAMSRQRTTRRSGRSRSSSRRLTPRVRRRSTTRPSWARVSRLSR